MGWNGYVIALARTRFLPSVEMTGLLSFRTNVRNLGASESQNRLGGSLVLPPSREGQ